MLILHAKLIYTQNSANFKILNNLHHLAISMQVEFEQGISCNGLYKFVNLEMQVAYRSYIHI